MFKAIDCGIVVSEFELQSRYYVHFQANNLWKGIIIIMSRRQRGYPWPSLAISPYLSSPPAGLQGYILCPHIVAVCMFVLVVPLLHIHMWGSTGVHRLWARPCFSSSDLRVWFVELVSFSWWGACVRIVGVSWGVVARTCLILLSTFFILPAMG